MTNTERHNEAIKAIRFVREQEASGYVTEQEADAQVASIKAKTLAENH